MAKNKARIIFHNSQNARIREMLKNSLEIIQTGGEISFLVPPNQSIHQAFQSLSIKLPQPAVALVGGKTRDFAYVLQPGDEVVILFQISGG